MYTIIVYIHAIRLGLLKRIDKERGWVNGPWVEDGVYGFMLMVKKKHCRKKVFEMILLWLSYSNRQIKFSTEILPVSFILIISTMF